MELILTHHAETAEMKAGARERCPEREGKGGAGIGEVNIRQGEDRALQAGQGKDRGGSVGDIWEWW